MFLSNIPSPYRIKFFNSLGKKIDLKVVFEAERNYKLDEKWYTEVNENFECIFLKKGQIQEKKINWRILKHIKKKEQDLIVVTNYSYFTEMLGLLYIKLLRIPYCLEVDGGIIKKDNIIVRYLKNFLIRGANAYISPSESTDEFLKYYGADKNKIFRYPFTSLESKDILPNRLSIEEKRQIRKELGITKERIIISVGRFVEIKGFDILIKACGELKDDIDMYFIGGKATQEYIDLREEYAKENIKFIEFIDKENLLKYYKAADLFVLATRGDVWGLVINEAMANGLPIITTDKCVAGIELIDDYENGFIVPVDNIKEFTSKINYILDSDEKTAQMSRNNIDKIRKYTIENMVDIHIKIFKELVGDK